MKRMNKVIFLIPLFCIACTSADLDRATSLLAEIQQKPLSQSEVASGLKGALVQGISRGSDQASRLDGYYKDPTLKIPLPPELQKVENTLRGIGLGSEVDKFVRQLNRGAEKAAAEAKPVFIDAITSLSITDAFSILNGEPKAATNYLIETTSEPLRSKFLPIISQSLNQVNATKYYDDIVSRYNKIPFVNKLNSDLNAYAADHALDGLFRLVAKEETNIRANPVARTTEILKKVFGSLNH